MIRAEGLVKRSDISKLNSAVRGIRRDLRKDGYSITDVRDIVARWARRVV